MIDIEAHLKGYVAGYWEAWSFAVDEGHVLTALGSALAPTADSAADLGQLRCSPDASLVSTPSSPAPSASSLAAIRRAAMGGDDNALDQVLAITFHQGVIHALRVAVELLRHEGEFDGARCIETMIRDDVEDGMG